MTTPKLPKTKGSSTSSSNSYVVLFVKILLVIIILLWLVPVVQSKRRRQEKTLQRIVHSTRMECELECAKWIPEESMDCLFQCISPDCYAQIFASEPLEPGEVDLVRATKLDKCLQDGIREQRRKERADRKNGVTSSPQIEEKPAGEEEQGEPDI